MEYVILRNEETGEIEKLGRFGEDWLQERFYQGEWIWDEVLDRELADGLLEKTSESEAEKIIAGTGENFAILNPAGGWVTKLWHAEKFGALADKIWEEHGLISIVTTAPNEKDLAEKVLQNSKSGKVFAAFPSLKGFFELAKKAKIYVGGDTAPTHLAVAAKTPVVGIFGPTEWWYNGSPNSKDICVERNDIGCRIDCNRRTCNKWICMDIKVETMLDAVRARLEKM